jgi:hypothetical protein
LAPAAIKGENTMAELAQQLLRNPSVEPEQDSPDPTPEPPNAERERFSLRTTVIAALVSWGFAGFMAMLL